MDFSQPWDVDFMIGSVSQMGALNSLIFKNIYMYVHIYMFSCKKIIHC